MCLDLIKEYKGIKTLLTLLTLKTEAIWSLSSNAGVNLGFQDLKDPQVLDRLDRLDRFQSGKARGVVMSLACRFISQLASISHGQSWSGNVRYCRGYKWKQMKSNEYSSTLLYLTYWYLEGTVNHCSIGKAPGASWGILGHPGASWGILGHPGASWGILGHPGALCTFFYTYLLTSCLVTNNVFKVHDPRRTNVAPPTRQSRSGFTWDLELQKIAEVTSFDHPAPLLKRIRHASCKPTFHRTTGQIASAVYRSSVLHISQLTLSKAGSHFS